MDKKYLENMTFRKKAEWFLQYYGMTTAALLIGVFLLFFLLKSIFFPPEQAQIRVLILDDGVSGELCDSFSEGLKKRLDTDGKIEVTAYQESDEIHVQAFAVRVMAEELTVVIAPEKEMKELERNGYFAYMEKAGEDSYYGKTVSGAGTDKFVGITAKNRDNPLAEMTAQYFLGNG